MNPRCLGVEYFRKSSASWTSTAYREGDCLLNSSSNIEWPYCDAEYYQMYFWTQGRFVECSDDKPSDTKAQDGRRTVNKNTTYKAPQNKNYENYNKGRKDIVEEFEDWIDKETARWNNAMNDANMGSYNTYRYNDGY